MNSARRILTPVRSTCPFPSVSHRPPFRDPARSFLRFWPEAAAASAGVLLALAYPPFDLGGVVWVWASPLLAALWFSGPDPAPCRFRSRGWRGLWLGFLSGFAFFLVNVSWVTEIGKVAGTVWAGIGGLVAMSAYLALYFAVFGAFAATVGRWRPSDGEGPAPGKAHLFGQSVAVLRVAFLNGAAWCGLEWLRGIVFTGFGWNGLGVALKDHLVLVQFAEVIGITGYGFLLMFAGTVLFCTMVRVVREVRSHRKLRPHFDLTVAAAMVAGLFLFGLSAFLREPGETVDLRARVFQFNVALEEKWSEDLRIRQKVIFGYRDLTRAFVETGPTDLVVWPETAVPGIFSSRWVQEYFNDHVLKGGDFYLLTGLEDANLENTEIYNTLTVMKGDTGSYQMHKKVHLVPFGEFIPLRGTFPPFEWLTGGVIEQDFTPGAAHEPLVVEKDGREIGIIPLICFEDTVPRHVREFLCEGPQVIVNVTNDGWFHESAQSRQHFDNAVFRCIEFRRPMIRCANTGVSGFIDERGSVYDRTGREKGERILRDPMTGSSFIRGSLPATLVVDLDPPITIYARIGDAFSVGMGAFALVASVWPCLRRRFRPGAPSPA